MTESDDSVTPGRIRSLDRRTIERIAAGEVVERPASAVKELVENSLDAGASRIEVEVDRGGIDRILVRDDGVGMTEAAVERAIERHTTSKLHGPDELDTGIETLGFRGEALYTIAAVGRLTIRTRPRGETAGTELRAAGGEIDAIEPVGCPHGTVVTVEELFFNTPARREFLSSTATEFDHVNRVVSNYALANPGVAISLTHDGREVFSTPGQGDLPGTIQAVWGREVAESMSGIDREYDDGPLDAIVGYLSDPETTRSRPRFVATFVNGRYVRSGVLRDAILKGYGHQLAPDRYPFVVLHSSVDPGAIDVNVHPRKLEVRFQHESTITEQVSDAVQAALVETGLVRSSAARGRSSPDETSVPGETQSPSRPTGSEPTAINSSSGGSSRRRDPERHIRGNTEQRTLSNETPGVTTDSLPDLEILGQLDETYIVAATTDGLVLIDQHAADERIHFERLRDQFQDRPGSQELVTPVSLSVTPDESITAEELREPLEQLGFEFTSANDEQVRLTAVPTVVDGGADPELFRDALEAWLEGSADAALESRADELLADLACYPAITGHTRLSTGSIVSLLQALDECENPYSCPHGRPVVIQIDYDEIDDRFERDYPGHAARRPEGLE